MIARISITEVSNVVSKAKLNKSVGHDYLPYEVFKNTQSCLLLTPLFNDIFDTGHIPSVWLQALIKPISKASTSDPRLPLQYRGISLFSTVGKLFWDKTGW